MYELRGRYVVTQWRAAGIVTSRYVEGDRQVTRCA